MVGCTKKKDDQNILVKGEMRIKIYNIILPYSQSIVSTALAWYNILIWTSAAIIARTTVRVYNMWPISCVNTLTVNTPPAGGYVNIISGTRVCVCLTNNPVADRHTCVQTNIHRYTPESVQTILALQFNSALTCRLIDKNFAVYLMFYGHIIPC